MNSKKHAKKAPAKEAGARAAITLATKRSPANKAEIVDAGENRSFAKKIPLEMKLQVSIGDGEPGEGLPGRILDVQKLSEPDPIGEKEAQSTTYLTSAQPGEGRPLDLISPSLLNEKVKSDPTFLLFARIEIEEHLRNWKRTGNGAFVWMAWRCMMHLDSVPSSLLAIVYEYLNECAIGLVDAKTPNEIAKAIYLSNPKGGAGKGSASAAGQREDYWFWVDFQTMTKLDPDTGRPTMTDRAAHKALARRYETTEGAVKQRLLRIEQAGQYKTRSRKR